MKMDRQSGKVIVQAKLYQAGMPAGTPEGYGAVCAAAYGDSRAFFQGGMDTAFCLQDKRGAPGRAAPCELEPTGGFEPPTC